MAWHRIWEIWKCVKRKTHIFQLPNLPHNPLHLPIILALQLIQDRIAVLPPIPVSASASVKFLPCPPLPPQGPPYTNAKQPPKHIPRIRRRRSIRPRIPSSSRSISIPSSSSSKTPRRYGTRAGGAGPVGAAGVVVLEERAAGIALVQRGAAESMGGEEELDWCWVRLGEERRCDEMRRRGCGKCMAEGDGP